MSDIDLQAPQTEPEAIEGEAPATVSMEQFNALQAQMTALLAAQQPVEEAKPVEVPQASSNDELLAELLAERRDKGRLAAIAAVEEKVGSEHLDAAINHAKSVMGEDELIKAQLAINEGGFAGEAILESMVSKYKSSENYTETDNRIRGVVKVGNTTVKRMSNIELATQLQDARRSGNTAEVNRLIAIGQAQG